MVLSSQINVSLCQALKFDFQEEEEHNVTDVNGKRIVDKTSSPSLVSVLLKNTRRGERTSSGGVIK